MRSKIYYDSLLIELVDLKSAVLHEDWKKKINQLEQGKKLYPVFFRHKRSNGKGTREQEVQWLNEVISKADKLIKKKLAGSYNNL